LPAYGGVTGLAELCARLEARRRGRAPYVVGITGAVAAGKSTLAAELAAALAPATAVEIVCTDGFLYDNATLAARNLLNRKGFPETYDTEGLRAALAAIRAGPATFPGYSHTIYDIDPALSRRLDPTGVLIVEGLGLQAGAAALGLDVLVYLDADEADLEAWFSERFVRLWREAEHDPSSFYARFRGMNEAETRKFAAEVVWRGINLPNLREHICKARDVADIVVRKGRDHAILEVVEPAR
jgi:type I pantothenate kinase